MFLDEDRRRERSGSPAEGGAAAICVPVRNEEKTLPATLRALAGLRAVAVELTICFYLDGCTDRSAAILGEAAASFPHPLVLARGLPGGAANAGRARREAMAMGLARLGTAAGAVLLTTDADSRPHSGWLAAARHALSLADIVAGRVNRDDPARDPLQSRLEHYYDRLHALRRALDPVEWEASETHHFTGGANLACRAPVYRALGGFAAVAHGEDALLADDASRAGFRVRRDAAMIVQTSSRRQGRAPGGLSAALRGIAAAGMPRVAHPAGAAWQYRTHAQARRAFARLADEAMRGRFGQLIGRDADHVLGVGRDCPNAEAFAMRIVPAAPAGGRHVLLAEAEDALAALERASCEKAA